MLYSKLTQVKHPPGFGGQYPCLGFSSLPVRLAAPPPVSFTGYLRAGTAGRLASAARWLPDACRLSSARGGRRPPPSRGGGGGGGGAGTTWSQSCPCACVCQKVWLLGNEMNEKMSFKMGVKWAAPF